MKNGVFALVILSFISTLIVGCGPSTPPTLSPVVVTERAQHSVGAFESGEYRNLFAEYLEKSDAEAKTRIDAAWEQLFYGDDDTERVYYPVDDMAYILDVGNDDVRSEGMSYGMMVAVQLDKKEEFDRLWKWAKTHMYYDDGPFKGYFAWQCNRQGGRLDDVPAPDGEEWMVMSLLFASARWGDGEGIFDYRAQAQEILDVMLHKEDEADHGRVTNMFDPMQKMVVFVPVMGGPAAFSDPSYHLPAYYELWARWAQRDNQFWSEAAQTSRAYFKKAAHPETGLMPDYAQFDGKPYSFNAPGHEDFRFDAFRTLSNVAVDYAWWAADPWQIEQSNRILSFLASQGMDTYPNQYRIDGEPLTTERSTGLTSMAAVAALAADRQIGEPFVQVLWDTPIPSGHWRYYDGMLYMFAMLHVSGNFKIYTPN